MPRPGTALPRSITRSRTRDDQTGRLQIRRRQDADLDQLETVARRVQSSDRYPIYLPDGDFRRFLTQPASIAAWVMTDEDRIVGHVALNDATSEPVMLAVDHLRDDRPARYIARLLVDPNTRRTGSGRALLEHARREAVAEGCLPVLDVVDIPTAAPAIALYRADGWQEIARVSIELGDLQLDEIVFVGSTA